MYMIVVAGLSGYLVRLKPVGSFHALAALNSTKVSKYILVTLVQHTNSRTYIHTTIAYLLHI